jgi:UDP-glucose 4-epimerase
MKVLVTGGAGFIGSHACLTLLEAGHSLVVVDNFEGSSAEPLQQVAVLAGLGPLERLAAAHWGTADEPRRLLVLQGDIRSSGDLDRAFKASSTAVV